MNILVVIANPKEKCFTRDAAATFIEEAQAKGHEVIVRDLYAMGFNPVASAEDLVGNLTGVIAPDVAEEQALVKAADVIVLVHPIWWIDRPAILKGYIDRVFALGFAYGYAADAEVAVLGEKRGIIITCSGSPIGHFTETGKMDAVRLVQDAYTMEFCNIKMIEHLHFGPVGRRSNDEMIEGYHQQIRDLVNQAL